MTPLNARIQQTIHYLVKPGVRAFLTLLYSHVADLVKEKDEKGWSSALVPKIRKVYKKFEELEINTGTFKDKNYRVWARQIFDLICLQLDVESPLTEKRWKQLVELARKEGLI